MSEPDRIRRFPAIIDDPSLRFRPRTPREQTLDPAPSLASAALAELARKADHMRMMASEATALLAHDLNNGLSVVKANLDYLAESLTGPIAADPETDDATRSAQRALDRMITLVKNFVDISRMEDAILVPNRTNVDVAQVVQCVTQIHLSRRSSSGVELVVDVAPELTARVDAMLLERVLHNLVGNATRYVNKGGLVRIAAKVIEHSDGVVLVLAVGNSGPPISEEARSRMFEKYAAGRDRGAQTGMGLYFCRLAAEAHGGTIGLRRTSGLGVDIEVCLPFAAKAQGGR
jgi:signal transduction histidine kinase